jgi:hypothetical protein
MLTYGRSNARASYGKGKGVQVSLSVVGQGGKGEVDSG